MSLENANGIWQLIATNPTIQDFVSQGDDHLRMLKRAIINTFPNIKGPILISHTDLNNIPSDLAGKINALSLASVPQGGIMGWDVVNKGTTIPAGWAFCNGQTVENYGIVPDMRNLHVKGANTIQEGGTLGGSNTASTTSRSGTHKHQASGGELALTVQQIPQINFQTRGSYGNGGYDGGNNVFFRIQPSDGFTTSNIIQSVGGGQAHTHPAADTTDAGEHDHTVSFDPAHYKMVWIVKTSALVLT